MFLYISVLDYGGAAHPISYHGLTASAHEPCCKQETLQAIHDSAATQADTSAVQPCKSKMGHVCRAGADGEPAVAGSDQSKRVGGDAGFDCNICLDFAVEPVVTLCGHLYCWPCIHEWLRRDAGAACTSAGRTSTGRPCPVCKAALTLDSLVPLYGRGGGGSKKPRPIPAIPRPPTVRREAVERQNAHDITEPDSPTRSSRHAHRHAGAARFDLAYPTPLLGGMAVAVLPSMLRGQVPPPGASPYHVAALENLSPRQRRQYMVVERSLHQIWFFLFVFVVTCLLLF